MPKDFLLEIGTEPMPARFVAPALNQLAAKLTQRLAEQRLVHGTLSTYGTLRRLAVLIEGLADASAEKRERVKGPPEAKLKDGQGAYTPQSKGFASKYGLTPDALKAENGFLWAEVVTPSRLAADVLGETVVQTVPSLEFPKSLTWNDTIRFGRPIRWLVALLGERTLPLELAKLQAGAKTFGLAVDEAAIALTRPAAYVEALRQAHVYADAAERRKVLLERLEKAAGQAGGPLDLDDELVEETVFMTEHPTPVVCSFSEEFLQLPAPLLGLVLKKQLKFFPVKDGAGLRARFVGVRDGLSRGEALVREGYQRVLAARGNDAVFFFKRDLASRLEAKLPMLGRVTYQKGLGTMDQKALRVAELTRELCAMVRQDRPVDERAAAEIARLCYADLVSEVVREFPELQGVMGGVYARRDGLDERVALGLEQFYLPVGPKSPVPTTAEGALVSLAGKLDALAGLFALGQAPTGSADPFGLRRAALGAIRIALEHQLPIDLAAAAAKAVRLQPVQCDHAAVARAVEEFLWGRAVPFLEEKGFRADEIRSVRRGGLKSLKGTYLRLAAIHAVRKNPDFEPLAEAFKRAANILRQAKVPAHDAEAPERALLKDPAELALFDALGALEAQVHDRLQAGSYENGLTALVSIKGRLDTFFEKVMVMAPDEGLKAQRLRLLARLVRLFNSVADLSEIQAPSSN